MNGRPYWWNTTIEEHDRQNTIALAANRERLTKSKNEEEPHTL
jgi:hypothetical protein